MTKTADVFRFWLAVEALTPHQVDKANPGDSVKPVYTVRDDTSLPWFSQAHKRKRVSGGRCWRYTLQAGIYESRDLDRLLEEKIGQHPEIIEAPPGKAIYLYEIGFDEQGRPLVETFALSMHAWAAGAILEKGVDALGSESACKFGIASLDGATSASGFPAFDRLYAFLKESLSAHLEKLKDADGAIQPADAAWVNTFTARVVDACWLSSRGLFKGSFEHRARCVQVKRKGLESDKQEDDLLNSFFINDLRDLSDGHKCARGAGILKYMESVTRKDKAQVDLRKPDGIKKAWEYLNPARHPAGRWPSDYPLAFSQQVAVNSLWSYLSGGHGLFAINGPPGTGKTTLLRDVIAAVVVERAKQLCKLDGPSDAFEGKSTVIIGNSSVPYYRFKNAWLTKTSIVVASSNNGAVENVSLELPLKGSIGDRWDGAVDYFARVAAALNSDAGNDQLPAGTGNGEPNGAEDHQADPAAGTAWALMAAKLGKSSNRKQFRDRFWFGPPERASGPTQYGAMREHLGALKAGAAKPLSWSASKARFTKALGEEGRLRQGLVDDAKRLTVLAKCRLDIERNRQQREDACLKLEDCSAQLPAAKQRAEADEQRYGEVRAERDAHLQSKPGLLDFFATLGGSHRQWNRRQRELDMERREAAKARNESSGHLSWLDKQYRGLQLGLHDLEHSAGQLTKRHDKLGEQVSAAKVRLRGAWPVDDESGEEARELSSPWATPEWNDARTEVFLAALELHRSFTEECAEQMHANLGLAADWLSGKQIGQELCQLSLDSLCLVIPVLSTTFASLPRLFSALPQEGIGWLLIDEAGQGLPQYAAGAIWRSQRTIVVGDPLQLEPVSTIPRAVEGALAHHYRVDQHWWPSLTSVQMLADHATPIGTRLPYGEGGETVWVGAPLRVHRRCEDPMFTISNQIAYDGLMVHGVKASSDDLPPSGWIDVGGGSSNGHWIREEGHSLEELIKRLLDMGVSASDLFLVSPFRTVAKELAGIAEQFGINKEQRGTVHTAQGKEARVVILVLGGDPAKPGAKDWAAEKPNLLNVAVSRAKRRLYVIGDKSQWKTRRHFGVAAGLLPTLSLESDFMP